MNSMAARNVFMEYARLEERSRRLWRLIGLSLGLALIIAGVFMERAYGAVPGPQAKVQSSIPQAALRYRADTIRTTRAVWGMDGPVADFAAQIQQESGWNPAAHSSVADGLAEFTPTTATWISGAYHLGAAQPYNPAWALRALVTYDKDLWDKVQAIPPPSATACDKMAFTLSAYNGGIKWVSRDRAYAASFHVPEAEWFGAVELFSTRSPAAFKENRGYPKRILGLLAAAYASWGPGVDCSVIQERPAWLSYSHTGA